MTTPLAYHNDPALKERTLAQMRAHRAADQLIRGTYWDGHRGCAVGCLTHNPRGGHRLFPRRWGIPEVVALLIDHIFEMLWPLDEALAWPERILDAIPVGSDLTMVWPQFAVWLLTEVIPSESGTVVAALYQRRIDGADPSATEWQWAARAAWAATQAAWDQGQNAAAAASLAAWRAIESVPWTGVDTDAAEAAADRLVRLCADAPQGAQV